MPEENVRQMLGELEGKKPTSTVRRSANERMLEAFDAMDTDGAREGRGRDRSGSGELSSVLVADRRSSQRSLPFAIAAGFVFVTLLVGGAALLGLFESDSARDLAEVNDVVVDLQGGSSEDTSVDEQLPRRIQGRFVTNVLGGTTSFVVREPLWLVRHEDDLVRLVVDPSDPASASLAIARPGAPAEAVGDMSVLEYLRDGSPEVDFQLQPLQVSGVQANYARGQYTGSPCRTGEPCLVLYDSPIPLGLQTDVINDFAERPMSDGGTVVLIAAIPFADFGIKPFERPFVSIAKTITFSDTETVGQTG